MDLLEDLCGVLPDNEELQTSRLLLSTLTSTNMNNTLLISKFTEHAREHQQVIRDRNLEGMVDVVRGLVGDGDVVDSFWGSLCRENQEVVADYVQKMWDIASPGANDSDADANGVEAGGNTNALQLLYNAAWRDLIKEVGMEDIGDKLDKLVTVKGKDHGVLWAIMEPVISLVMVDQIGPDNVASVLMPPQDAAGSIEADILCIGENTPMPLAPKATLTMADFLRNHVAVNSRAILIFHYIKVMAGVKTSCPPDVIELMSHMIQGSDLF